MAEHFQPTERSWIHRQVELGERGLVEVHEHIAETYQLPLQIYYSATSWARERGADPDWSAETVVHEFLADRLTKPGYIEKWTTSGLRLRRWLINGLHLFLKEHFRATRRIGGNDEEMQDLAIQDEPGVEADRVMIYGLVRQAIKNVVDAFESSGQPAHAVAFVRVYLDQVSVADVAEEINHTTGQIKGMLRVARSRFKKAFEEVLLRDGITAEQVEQEIEAMMEIIEG